MNASRVNRAVVAVVVGLVAAALMWGRLRAEGSYAYALDFTPHWRAADAMLRGVSPYEAINGFSKLYQFSAGFRHLLPAALIVLPFGYLQPQPATIVFAGVSIALLTYALTTDGWWRLPLLASAPMVYNAVSGQTVPLVVAAMLIPSLGWLSPVKFTLGVAVWSYQLSLRYALLGLGVVVLSIVAFPWWPLQFFHELSDVASASYYHVPVAMTGGIVLLAAFLRWRRPEARLLGVMSCLPQTMFFYDQLPLMVVARTYRQALVVAVASWIPVAISVLHFGNAGIEREVLFAWNAPIIVACYYIPCLVIVLLRPNEGDLPAWITKLWRRPIENHGTLESITAVATAPIRVKMQKAMAPRTDMVSREAESWRPPVFTATTTQFQRWLVAARRFLDLQAGTIWRDLSAVLPLCEGTLVDVGCGAQPYRALLGNNAVYVGIDTANAKAHFGYEMPDTMYYEGDRWPLDDASADTVLCTETLEHVPDTAQFLSEVARVLRPDGTLVLTVPFAARYRFIPYDYWRFTPSLLQRMLMAAGLGNVAVYARGDAVTVAFYKAMALMLPLLFAPYPSRTVRLLRGLGGVACSPILLVLAAIANISVRGRGGDDCLGYTVVAYR